MDEPSRKLGRPKGRGPIDWRALELLYIEGEVTAQCLREFPSYADLAGKFGIGVGSVAGEGRKRGWPDKRTAFQEKLARESERKVLENASDSAALFAAEAGDLARKLVKMISRMVGPAPLPSDDRYCGPELEKIERAEKLARVLKVVAECVPSGGGGRTPASPNSSSLPDGPLTPQQRDVALAAARSVLERNESPTAVTGVPGDD